MKYNPDLHHRRSIRLKGYNYSQAGLYFVTICVQNHECLFGEIIDGAMILNDYGNIVRDEWQYLTTKYPHIKLHEYVIMPNHFHGIVEIGATVGAGFARPDGIVSDVGAGFAHPDGIANDDVGAGSARPDGIAANVTGTGDDDTDTRVGEPRPYVPTLGNIIGYFKYQTTKKIDLPVKLWQRNYWENIIRNEQSYQYIANYVINNPIKWENDRFYAK